ncbi:MAG: VanZ family protein [Hyphomicrobiales bacterium]
MLISNFNNKNANQEEEKKVFRLNTLFLIMLLGAIFGFSSQYASFETRYLATKASAKTSFWTQHFIKRLPKLGVDLQAHETDPVITAIAVGNTIGLTNDIVESSQLFQVDYINPNCLCTISIGSYAGKLSNEITPTSPNREMARAVFFDQHDGKKHQGHLQNNKFQVPVNFQNAKSLLNGGSNDIFIFKTDQIDLPNAYAAVYQTVNSHNHPMLLIRSLVPLTTEAQSFFIAWYCVYSVLIILLLALLYKAFKMKEQQFHPLVDTFSKSPKGRSNILTCLFFVAFLVVVVGSYYSPDFNAVWELSHDKVKHMIAYFSLTAMGLAACHRFHWSKYLVLVIFAIGVFIELTQPFAGRSASLLDMVANSVGIALGSMIASWCGFQPNAKKAIHAAGEPIRQD